MKPNDILLHKTDGILLHIISVNDLEAEWEAEACTGYSLIENLEEFFDIVGSLD